MGDNSSGAVIVRRRPWWTSLLAPIVAVVVVAGSAPACDGTATETTDPDGRGPRQPNATTTTLMVTRALNRLRESTRDYRLMDDLWFETLPPAAAFQPRPAPANLVQLADAVFDVRRLSWRNAIVDGMDLTLYKDRALQRYTFALTRHDRTADDQSSDTGKSTCAVTLSSSVSPRLLSVLTRFPIKEMFSPPPPKKKKNPPIIFYNITSSRTYILFYPRLSYSLAIMSVVRNRFSNSKSRSSPRSQPFRKNLIVIDKT